MATKYNWREFSKTATSKIKMGQSTLGGLFQIWTLISVTVVMALSSGCNVRRSSKIADVGALDQQSLAQAPVLGKTLADSSFNSGVALEKGQFCAMFQGADLVYSWSKDGVVLPSQTKPCLLLTSLAATDNGLYTVVATNSFGNIASSAKLTVLSVPAVSQALGTKSLPAGINLGAGDFCAMFTGEGLSYSWSKNGMAMTGQSKPCLLIPNLATTDGGSYTVTASNSRGSVVSSGTLTVGSSVGGTIDPAPVMATALVGGTYDAGTVFGPGSDATVSHLCATFTGTNISFSWKKDNVALINQTKPCLFLSGASMTDSGTYVLEAKTSGGVATSSAVLTINPYSWNALSYPVSNMKGAIQVSDAGEIYAMIGNRVAKWNGMQFVFVTTDAPAETTAAFRVVSENSIYVMIGRKICKFNGVSWAAVTTVEMSADPKPAFHLVAENQIYVMIGNKICKWNGSAWGALTSDTALESKAAFHFVSESQIYIMVGNKICKWNGSAWAALTTDAPAETKSVFQFESESLIYVMIGNRICKWDGSKFSPVSGIAPADTSATFKVNNAGLIFTIVGGDKICVYRVNKAKLPSTVAKGWAPLTPEVAGMKGAIQVSSEGRIYAMVGNHIERFNGVAFEPITTDAPAETTAAFHVVSDSAIYVILGQNICKWNGTSWGAINKDSAGTVVPMPAVPLPAMHFVAENQIYVMIGKNICKWNGTSWGAINKDAAGTVVPMPLDPKPAFKMVNENLIYVMIGNKICKFTNGVWAAVTVDAPAETKPAFQVSNESQIYVMIGNKICKYNGVNWAALTLDAPATTAAAFKVMDDDTVYAMVGIRVCRFTYSL